jgi:hypothetical protein
VERRKLNYTTSAECRALSNEFVIAELSSDKLTDAGGYRYIEARKPDLYKNIIGKPHDSNQQVAWLKKKES